jgi:Holliday junction resolvase RusA-like endonuclease
MTALEHGWALSFHIIGEPKSKSRARVTYRAGRAMSYTPAETVKAEHAVAKAYRDAGGPAEPSSTSTFGLRLSFVCGTRQRRDLDNMTKLVLDGLNGVAFADDSQVTELTANLTRGAGAASACTIVEIYESDPAIAGYLAELQPCEHCGQPIRVYPSTRGRIYCSTKCAAKAKTSRPSITCERCGKAFRGASNRRYCSRDCSAAASVVTITCPCGQSFRAQRAFDRKFCSVGCANRHKARRTGSASVSMAGGSSLTGEQGALL